MKFFKVSLRLNMVAFVFFMGLALSPMGFAMGGKKSVDASQSTEPIWITRSDGARGCELGSGQTLEAGAEQLKAAQVHVLQSRKGHDGKMHAQVCGAPVGTQNAFLIPKGELPLAIGAGYQTAP